MTPSSHSVQGDFDMFNSAEFVSQSNLSQRAAERYAQLSAVAEAKRKPNRKPVRRRSLKPRIKPVNVQ
jgi:hypothetical protein